MCVIVILSQNVVFLSLFPDCHDIVIEFTGRYCAHITPVMALTNSFAINVVGYIVRVAIYGEHCA